MAQSKAKFFSKKRMSSLREEWRDYVEERTDFEVPVKLLTKPYKPLAPIKDVKSYSTTEVARYLAEMQFFGERSQAVEGLLGDIVNRRYRGRDSRYVDPVDLENCSARTLISAARLFQERLVVLAGSYNCLDKDTFVGLPIATRSGRYFSGPRESYCVGLPGGAGTVLIGLNHRTEVMGVPYTMHPERLGGSFVHDIGTYPEILDQLESIMDSAEYDQEFLGDLFLQFARSNGFSSSTPVLRYSDRKALARICFLILEIEQSQWQSACYFGGSWKLGMAVSFARLIRMFKDGIISLHDMFKKYPIYSTPKMLDNCPVIRETCRKIDRRYKSEYEVELTRERAQQDLAFLYGE